MGEAVPSVHLVRRVVAVVVLALGAGAAALALWSASASAEAPACTVSWLHPVSGSWDDGASWSTGAVPAEADDVCIDVGGTYQVSFDGTATVHSLTVGAGSGTQTLSVLHDSLGDELRVTAGTGIQARGVLHLRSTLAGSGFAFRSDDPVVNQGVLRFADGTHDVDFYGDITNAASGRVEVDDVARIAVSAVVNDGVFDVNPFSILFFLGGSFASNPGSSIDVGGVFEGGDLTFTQAGGTVTAGSVSLSAGSHLIDSAGSGSFVLLGDGGASTLSGTIPAGQTVTILGLESYPATAELQGNVVNNGTLQLDETDSVAVVNGTEGLTNNGTIRTLGPDGGFRILGVEITNSATGTIDIEAPSTMLYGTTNDGTVRVLANGSAYVDSSTFTSNPGSTLDLGHGGTMTVVRGTFRQAGGDVATGNPVVLIDGSTLDTSSGGGSYLLEPGNFVVDAAPNTIKGTIAAGQLVTVRATAAGGSTAVLAAPGVVNNGVLRLASSDPAYAAKLTGGPLTNNLVLALLPGDGQRFLEVPITNGTNGEIAVGKTTFADHPMVNNGVVSLEDDAHLVFSSGSYVNRASATLRVSVNTTIAPAGRVSVLGGTITATMGGTLDVVTIGSPVLGRSYTPITASTRVGTFAKVTSGLLAYQATYSPTAVGLVASPPRARFVPISPVRILDTRTGNGAPQGRVPAGGVISLPVAGIGGSGPTAVVLTVTTTDSSPGFVTVWPSGQAQPTTSNLNTTRPGQTIAVQVVVPIGADGTISFFTSGGGHLLADIAGWYENVASATSGRFSAVAPSRILDTRNGTGAPAGRRGAGTSLTLPVAGRGGVPASGASAVVLSVTEVDASPGWVTVWPSGQARPNASNLNTDVAGQIAAAHVTVPLGSGGAVDLFTSGGGHLLVDVVGWFTNATAADSTSGLYVALSPVRRIDTRTGLGVSAAGPRPARSTVGILLGGSGGIPTGGVAAVVASLTAVDAAPTYLTAWAGGAPRPLASNLNVTVPGDTVPNLVTSPVGGGAFLNLYTDGATHLLLDTTGYYTN